MWMAKRIGSVLTDVETTRLKCVILAKSHEGFVLAL